MEGSREGGNSVLPRRDTYHDILRKALIADGWTITHDPCPLKYGDEDLYVDIGIPLVLLDTEAERIVQRIE
jgi:hypothetical protein